MVNAKEIKTTMCKAPCSFLVKNHGDAEMIQMMLQHARQMHNMEISEKEVRVILESAWNKIFPVIPCSGLSAAAGTGRKKTLDEMINRLMM